jgi:hypothetical protein
VCAFSTIPYIATITQPQQHYIQSFPWPLPALITEERSADRTSIQAASEFVQQNMAQDDLVACIPNYFDYPLIFASGDKIFVCNQADPTGIYGPEHLASLPVPKRIWSATPKWVFDFGGHMTFSPNSPGDVQDNGELTVGARTTFFSKSYTLAQTSDIDSHQTQRPEITWHSFFPPSGGAPAVERLRIWRLAEGAASH